MPQFTDANGIIWNYTLDASNNASIGDGTNNGGNATTQGQALSGSKIIPSTVGGYPVTGIGQMTFRYCASLTSVTIPTSVTSIGRLAFGSCGVTSAIIPNLVTSIVEGTFSNNTNVTSVTLGDSVTSIGNYAFNGCNALTFINIPETVITIGTYGFAYGTSLTSIKIPDSVTSIAADAFVFNNTALVVTIRQSRAQAFGFVGNLPLYNQTFFGGTSVTLVLPPPSPPTITITATANGSPLTSGSTTKNTPIVVTFTSSASTTDFAVGDITLTNGSLNSSFAGIGTEGTVYTATFTPTGQGPIVCTINVPANKFTASGLNNIASAIFTFTFDAPPTMTITSTIANNATTNIASIPLTFTSSEAITGFTRDDISFNNGTLSAITVSSATVRTATFTPTIQGAYTINVPVGSFTDASGNSNTAASTFTFNFDAAPTMVITSTTLASGATSNIASIPLTFTASEAITDFAVEDISFNKGSLTAFASSSATVYTATFTQGGQGEHIINVPVGVYIDASGNANTAASSFNWTYDSVQPNMDISSTTFGVTSGSTTNNSTIALRFTSSKPTNDFLVGDISFNKGSLGDLSGSGTVYTATFTPNGQGAHTIYVPSGAYIDSAGNNNTASNTFTWSYDSVSPSMDISAGVARGSTTKTTPIALTFTSTEATNNFQVEDISFNNGTLSNFASVSPTVYTATFTPTSPGPVACTIDVLAGAYTDAATNLNNLATQFAFTFDSVPPTMTITSTTAGVTNGSTIDNPTIALTFTSSKATNNFQAGDISVTNGTLSAFASSSGTDGKVYTATFTPTRQGLCTIGVAAGAYFDAASNNNAAATTFSFGYIPKFAEFNNANNLEQTYITGFLDVSGTINHRSGDLTVMDGNVIVHTGDAYFNNSNFYVPGNVSVNSNMAVVGTTKLTSLVARDNLDVSGASTLDGSLTVAGITSLNNHVSIANNKQFTVGTGKALFGGDVSLNSNLIVDNGASLKSSVDVSGSTVFANTAVNGTLLFNTRPSFASDVSLNAPNVDICGNLYAQYAANSIPASAIVGGAGNVIETDVSMNAGLNVAGATTLSAVATSGDATIGGTLNIIGASTMSTLSISNATTIGGPLNVMGITAFLNDVSFNGSRIDICGNLYANYPANSIPSSALMGGGSSMYNTDVSMNAGLFVSNAVNLGSTLVVSGKTAFTGDISLGTVNGSRIDICGNLYANYPPNSIPQSAIVGGVGSLFTTDVSMNAGLYVKNGITLDTITMQYQETPSVGLYVNAALNATTLSSSGNATLNNTLTVTGATTFSSTLNVTGAATLGSLNVSGATTTAALSTTGAVTFMSTVNLPAWSPFTAAVAGRSTLAVVGATTLKSTLTVAGATTMNSGLSVFGATTMNTTLNRVGAATMAAVNAMNILNISGATTLGSTLAVTGATTLASLLAVTGTSQFRGDYTMSSTLNVLGDVSLNSTLNVTAATTLAALTVERSTTMATTLRVNQTALFGLDLITSNTLTVTGDVSMNTRLSVGGATSFRSTLAVAGPTTLAALTTTGNTIIGDRLVVSGVTTFSQDASLNVTSVDISGVVNVGQLTIGQTALQYRPNIFKLGGDIDGEFADDRSGYSVSLSADGSILAIGATQNDGTTGTLADVRGHVRVYKRNVANTTIAPIGWTQLGGDIDGEAAGDGSGVSVSLVSDPSSNIFVAIGANNNDGTVASASDNRGHVRVYQYVKDKLANANQGSDQFGPAEWKRLGSDIDGEAAGDTSGISIALSANWPNVIVAIGATQNSGASGATSGHVRVYKYIQDKLANTNQGSADFGPAGWKRLGSDIDGEATTDISGYSVSLSADGSIVAIGAVGNTSYRGHVKVYKYQLLTANNTWSQLGSDIDGEVATDFSGKSVSLSADGYTVAIGAFVNDGATGVNSGHVRVYKYGLVTANTWSKLGGDIDGEAANDTSGQSVSLSGDGTTLAIYANTNGGNGVDSGHVRIYKYDPNKSIEVTNQSLPNFGPVGWTRFSIDIDGEAANNGDEFGKLVSLSADGSTVAIGGPRNDGTALLDRGSVRVYQLITIPGLFIDASLNAPTIATTGFASVGGVLSVTGATTMSNTLFVTGASTFVTLSSINGTTIGGTLNVNGATTVGSTLRVNGAATVTSLTTNSNTTVGGILNVASATTMGALNYTGQLLQW